MSTTNKTITQRTKSLLKCKKDKKEDQWVYIAMDVRKKGSLILTKDNYNCSFREGYHDTFSLLSTYLHEKSIQTSGKNNLLKRQENMKKEKIGVKFHLNLWPQ